MSFSFYEQWVNTAHVNDILTQRAMNNASEFTFMPESDPSRHPFPPSPSLLHLFPSSILTIHPHQSSDLFLPSSSSSSTSHPSLTLFLSPSHTSIKQETAQGPALIYFLPVSVFVIWLRSDVGWHICIIRREELGHLGGIFHKGEQKYQRTLNKKVIKCWDFIAAKIVFHISSWSPRERPHFIFLHYHHNSHHHHLRSWCRRPSTKPRCQLSSRHAEEQLRRGRDPKPSTFSEIWYHPSLYSQTL